MSEGNFAHSGTKCLEEKCPEAISLIQRTAPGGGLPHLGVKCVYVEGSEVGARRWHARRWGAWRHTYLVVEVYQ